MRLRNRLVLVLNLAAPAAALACPLCDSERAKEVRAGLLDAHLGKNVAAAALPFAVLAALVVGVHCGGSRSGSGVQQRAQP